MNTFPPSRVNALSDQQLWEKSRAGDRDAFRQIVERYQTLVCSLAYSRSGRLAWSEDLAQETFVIAWQRLGELRDPHNLRAWLCGIVRNLASNATRREFRQGGPPAPLADAPELTDASSDPAAHAISQEEAAMLWRSLEQLPETYREPMVLFYRQGQSVREVALTLELSDDAVKQRLSRGRSQLRDELATLVETALVRTRPTAAFTVTVLAAVAMIAPPSAKAAMLASAATAPAASSSAGKALLGILSQWVFLGPALGLLVGWFSTRLAASTARSATERECVVRFARRTVVFCWLMVLILLAGLLPAGRLYPASPWWIVAAVLTWTVALVGWILFSSSRVDREILRIRVMTGTDDASYGDKLAAQGLSFRGLGEFESKTRLLGIPLLAIACGRVDGPTARPQRRAIGWIACGNIAISPLIALGSVAIGPVAVGACTLGFLSFSLWGIAIGGVAFGSFAAGWWAYGLAALGWDSAVGGAALARDYALGPFTRAVEANTPAAQAWITSHWSAGPAQAFFYTAHWLILLIILIAWGRMWLEGRQRRRQDSK